MGPLAPLFLTWVTSAINFKTDWIVLLLRDYLGITRDHDPYIYFYLL